MSALGRYKEIKAKIAELEAEATGLAVAVAEEAARDKAPLRRARATGEAAPKRRRGPDPEKAAKKYGDYEPAQSGCLCGCGEEPATGNAFVKGCARKFTAIIAAIGAEKLSVEKLGQHAWAHIVDSEPGKYPENVVSECREALDASSAA